MERSVALAIAVSIQCLSGSLTYAEAPPGRYTVTDETVRDNRTLLMWQRSVAADSYSQSAASSYCASLDLAGHSDWRLPTRTELSSLSDSTRVNPAIDPNAFPGTPLAWFWTTSAYVNVPGRAWRIDFALGAGTSSATDQVHRVRCVR